MPKFEREELSKYNLKPEHIEEITTAEETAQLDLLEKHLVNNTTAKNFGTVEQIAAKEFGVQKENGEKATEMFLRGAKQKLTANTETLQTQLNDKIAAYNELEKAKGTDTELKGKLEALENERKLFEKRITDTNEDWTKKYSELQKGNKDLLFKNNLTRVVPTIEHPDKDYLNYRITSLENQIKTDYEIEVDSKGAIHLKKDYQTFQLNDLVKEGLKDLIEGQEGFGGNPDKKKGVVNFAKAKTKIELKQMLETSFIKAGKDVRSSEFSTELNGLHEKYKHLPLKLN